MAPGDVLYEKDGQLAIITINRPHRMNALTMAGWTYEMAEIWEDFQNDRALRVAILTAVGDRAFCAGVDVKETAERNACRREARPRRPRRQGLAVAERRPQARDLRRQRHRRRRRTHARRR